MRVLRVLSSALLVIVPLGLSGCWETNAPPTAVSPSPLSTDPPIATAPPTTPPTLGESPSPTAKPVTATPEVYWLQAGANKVELIPAQINLDNTDTHETQLKAAIERLLKGPANSDVSSAIPAETQLLALKVKSDGVHIDLSKSFISGGGSTSMQGRLGQVIYTASSLNPADPVWISIDGEPLKVLGGEGLEVSQPMTRTEFTQNFSL